MLQLEGKDKNPEKWHFADVVSAIVWSTMLELALTRESLTFERRNSLFDVCCDTFLSIAATE